MSQVPCVHLVFDRLAQNASPVLEEIWGVVRDAVT